MKLCDVCGESKNVRMVDIESFDKLGAFDHPDLCESCRDSVKIHLSNLFNQINHDGGLTNEELNHIYGDCR